MPADSDAKPNPAPTGLVGGRYRVVGPLGSGSMGDVYRAVHEVTGQPVALKMLQSHVVRSAGGMVRFLREVRAASAVAHPGVVPVYDAGSHEDTLYIAMELLEGETLRERLLLWHTERTPGSAGRALSLVRASLEPLAAAHTAGIIHRDYKPDNVYLQRLPDGREQVRLLDFGIATNNHDGSATQTGFTMGTPFYMSPEQAMDPRTCTPASDVWSVGCVLYEILAGRVPFQGPTAQAVCISAIRDAHAPITALPDAVPMALVKVVDACLSKDAVNRPADARALAAMLDGIGMGLSQVDFAAVSGSGVLPSFPPTWTGARAPSDDSTPVVKRRRVWPVAVAVACVLSAGAVAWWAFSSNTVTTPKTDPGEPVRVPLAPPTLAAPPSLAPPSLAPRIPPSTPASAAAPASQLPSAPESNLAARVPPTAPASTPAAPETDAPGPVASPARPRRTPRSAPPERRTPPAAPATELEARPIKGDPPVAPATEPAPEPVRPSPPVVAETAAPAAIAAPPSQPPPPPVAPEPPKNPATQPAPFLTF